MEVNVILANYIEIIKQIYGSILEKIILFGSYARGDNYPFFNNIENEGIVLYPA